MKLLSALDHRSPAAPSSLTGLAERIERQGLSAIEPSVLRALAQRARQVGVHPEVADLVADTDAPTVVRLRAFGLVHRRLVAATPVETDPVLAAA